MKVKMMAAIACGLLSVSPAIAADKIKIGFVNTFTGASGILGKHYRDAFDLAVSDLGQKFGGLPVEVIYGDDQLKPDIAKSVVEKMIERDRVDIVAGFNFTNVLLSSIDVGIGAGKIVLSSNAGPATLAGEKCSPQFFSVGHQNDGAAEAMGQYLRQKNVENVLVITPNYQAGREMVDGFKRGYKAPLVGEIATSITQNDYSAELSQIRAKNPSAVFAFMPGGAAITFIKQWSQAGLKDKIPLYSVYTVDNVTLPAIGDAAIGVLGSSQWVEDLPGEQNQKFVQAFYKKYRYMPSEYAANAYDTALLIDSAVRLVNGKIEDRAAFLEAFSKADFKSNRGNLRFNTNNFVIQDYHLREVVRGPSGELGFKTKETIVKDYKDAYAEKCKMK